MGTARSAIGRWRHSRNASCASASAISTSSAPNASNDAISSSVAGFTAMIWLSVVAICLEDIPSFVREWMHRSQDLDLDRRRGLLEPLAIGGHAHAGIEPEV